jgi:hypothetical protein
MTAPTAPTIRKLGPGTLTIGTVGSPLDFSGQAPSAAVTWDKDSEDNVKVLSGATIGGDVTYTASLAVTVYQDDLSDGGLVEYTWSHKGEQVPFTYTPYSGGKSITGELVIDPLDVGGEVGKKNTSDIEWTCVGEPELVDDLT